jgi:hypothetical protein
MSRNRDSRPRRIERSGEATRGMHGDDQPLTPGSYLLEGDKSSCLGSSGGRAGHCSLSGSIKGGAMREAGKSVCGTIRGVMADLSILLSQPTVSVLYFVDSESTTEMEMVKVQMICIQR